MRDADGLVRLYPPVAAGETGLVRSDFTLPEAADFQPIGHVLTTMGKVDWKYTEAGINRLAQGVETFWKVPGFLISGRAHWIRRRFVC